MVRTLAALSFDLFLWLVGLALLHPHEILVLLFELTLHVLEALFDFSFYVLFGGFLQNSLLEEIPIDVPYEFKHLALGKGGYLVAVQAVAIENPNYFDVAIQDNENVVLVLIVRPSLL